MSEAIIEASVRTTSGKGDSGRLRVKGRIPAVFYGPGQTNLHLSIPTLSLEKAVAGPLGMNTLIELKIDNGASHKVLLKDYQADPIKRFFKHADFIHVDANKKIRINIPVHLVGKPVGIKEGGILEQITRELEVLCLPSKILQKIDIDISELKIGDNLHLHDVKFPEGVEPLTKTDVTIAAIIKPRDEVVETPAEGTSAEPEVLTAKKDDAAAAGAAGAADKGKDAKKEGDKAKK